MGWKNLSKSTKIVVIIGGIAIILFLIFYFIKTVPSTKDKYNAALLVDSFYFDLNNEDYEKLIGIIHQDWYGGEINTAEKTIDFFESVNKVYGKIEDYTLIDWETSDIV